MVDLTIYRCFDAYCQGMRATTTCVPSSIGIRTIHTSRRPQILMRCIEILATLGKRGNSKWSLEVCENRSEMVGR